MSSFSSLLGWTGEAGVVLAVMITTAFALRIVGFVLDTAMRAVFGLRRV